MLLYYFKDKRELIAAILARVCARFAETLATAELTPARPAGTLARELPELATRMPLWRFMQIRFEIVALATRGDAACAHAAESLTRALFAWIARGIAGDPARRPSEAALLLQLLEGSMMLKASGSEDLRTLTMRPAAG